MYQKTNVDGLIKDTNNNVVVNNNTSEYETYLLNKNRIKQSKNLQEDVEMLKKELKELKDLFQQCLDRKK